MSAVKYQGPYWDFLTETRGNTDKWARSLIRRKKNFQNWLKENGYPYQDPKEISKKTLRKWHAEMMEQYASSTVRKRLAAISNWFKYHNCETMENMVFRTPSKGHTKKEYYKTKEENKLWKAARELSPKHSALVACNLGVGMRRIGCYRLKWSDINLKKRYVKIYGKAKKDRDVKMLLKVVKILEHWKEIQQQKWKGWKGHIEEEKLIPRVKEQIPLEHPPKHVFTTDPKNSLKVRRNWKELTQEEIDRIMNSGCLPFIRPRRKTLTKWLKKVGEKAEQRIKDGFRGGRRTFGRNLYEETKDRVFVTQYLGHESEKTTMEYLALEGFDMDKHIETMDNSVKTAEELVGT